MPRLSAVGISGLQAGEDVKAIFPDVMSGIFPQPRGAGQESKGSRPFTGRGVG